MNFASKKRPQLYIHYPREANHMIRIITRIADKTGAQRAEQYPARTDYQRFKQESELISF